MKRTPTVEGCNKIQRSTPVFKEFEVGDHFI
jgi:hypothetical protein